MEERKNYLEYERVELLPTPKKTEIVRTETRLPAQPIVDWRWAADNAKVASVFMLRLAILVAPWLFFGGLGGIILVVLIKAILVGLQGAFTLAIAFFATVFKIIFAGIFILIGLFFLFMLLKALIVNASSSSKPTDEISDDYYPSSGGRSINIEINPTINIRQ